MKTGNREPEGSGQRAGLFATTHWSVVLAAGRNADAKVSAALEQLCRTYWYPLYVYIRRRGHSPEDAQDLTQAFFAHLLEKQAFRDLEREGGKFRSFLLTALNHFLVNEWARRTAGKRGAGVIRFSLDGLDPEARYQIEPREEVTPETCFERQWAATLLERVMIQLRDEHIREGNGELFAQLQPCLTGAEPMLPYAQLAARLGLTEGAVKMAVHRLRKRYGALLREEMAHTLADPRQVEEEIRHLIAITAR